MSRETCPPFVLCRICQQLISSRNALTKQLIISLIKKESQFSEHFKWIYWELLSRDALILFSLSHRRNCGERGVFSLSCLLRQARSSVALLAKHDTNTARFGGLILKGSIHAVNEYTHSISSVTVEGVGFFFKAPHHLDMDTGPGYSLGALTHCRELILCQFTMLA